MNLLRLAYTNVLQAHFVCRMYINTTVTVHLARQYVFTAELTAGY